MDPANFVLRPFTRKEQEEVFTRIVRDDPVRNIVYSNIDPYENNKGNENDLFMQLDFAFHRGLEAVRIMVLEGFNKSATYVNTSQSSEMLNG
jgi:peptidyl-tRNA hydrolase, PTH1 family